MAEDVQNRVLSALLLAIRPIAKALMHVGIGYREFADVAKLAFVQVATEEYGLRGRPTNVSRVSVITGISRKEVGKLRAEKDFVLDNVVRGTPAGELLHRWHTDPRYLDVNQKPKDLPIEGESCSFGALVKEVGGDVPLGAMKKELLRVNAVAEIDKEWVRALKRHYVPARVDDKLLHGFDTAMHYLAETIAYNANPHRAGDLRFERVVSAINIPINLFEEVALNTKEYLERYTVEYDDYLSKIEKSSEDGNVTTEIGVGFYYFESVGSD